MRLGLMIALPLACFAQSVISYNFDPPVIGPATQNLRIEARISGTPSLVLFEPATLPVRDVAMSDAGATGDLIPGDGVYTTIVPAQPIAALLRSDDVFRTVAGYVKIVVGQAVSSRVPLMAEFAPPSLPRYPVTVDAPDMQHTQFVVNIHRPDAFPTPEEPTTLGDIQFVVQRFYQSFPDEFDMVNVVYVPAYLQQREHIIARNDVQGIGLAQMNLAALYGSAGRLRGINRFPVPSDFDTASAAFLHEFGHQWINYLGLVPFSGGTPHWPISSLASGPMGFSTTTNRAGGDFPCTVTIEGAAVRLTPRRGAPVFTPMDLYLMGFTGPEDVGEVVVFGDQDLDTVMRACAGALFEGTTIRQRLADMIVRLGERRPVAAASPKEFRVATIVVTRDALLDADGMALYSYFARRGEETGEIPSNFGSVKSYAKPFSLATSRKAKVTTVIEGSKPPEIFYAGVVNGSSSAVAAFAEGYTAAVSPNSYVAIYGANFAGTESVASGASPLPRLLGGVSVLVNGRQAFIYYAGPGQINIQLPSETESGLATLAVLRNGVPSSIAWIRVAPVAPGINVFGANRAAARNQDNSINLSSNPAQPGTFLSVYFTGIGPLDNPVPAGQPAPLSPLSRSSRQVSATIGGRDVTVQFAGLTPLWTGLAQVNLVVPDLPLGDYPVVITIDGVASNAPMVTVGR